MKQSKGSKQVKVLNLSSLDQIYNESLGNRAAGKPAPANTARADQTQLHAEKGSYDDPASKKVGF